MNSYEGLIILDGSAKEEAITATVDRLQKEIEQAGGRVQNLQKLGSRPLPNNSKKLDSGFYVNVFFNAPSTTVAELDAKFHLASDVFRWQFLRLEDQKTEKPKRKSAKKEAKAATE